MPNLFGTVNNADLALIRGAAEFGNDFDDEIVKERMQNIFICEKHAKELVFKWKESKDPMHVSEKRVRGVVSKPACSLPNTLMEKKHQSDTEPPLAKASLFLRKDMAKAFLKARGAHLHIGIREYICDTVTFYVLLFIFSPL